VPALSRPDSSGRSQGWAAAAYVREGFSDIRMGMFLEIATTLGALTGAYFAHSIKTNMIAIICGVVLMYSAVVSFRGEDRIARLLGL
jgi:uncharacterized membrane protein YfcA